MIGKIRRKAAGAADAFRLFFMLAGLAFWLIRQKRKKHYFTVRGE